ncbi:MAG TPA: hypothetical protein ENN21_06215, partial [Spirochaetes bacterium]|nr:hypothetical protein [Spirochaetota bacterium]
MESIGEKLTAAREAKKLTRKDVAKETNISLMYIEALENEEFDKFPGETYVTGFLRSYADYLKLDADEIVQHYKAYKIGESATPIEELTRPTRAPIMVEVNGLINQYRNFLIIGGGILGVVLIVWLFTSLFSSGVKIENDDSLKSLKNEYNLSKQSLGIENIRTLQIANDSGFVLLYKNEAAQFLVDNKEVLLLLKAITADGVEIEMHPGEKTGSVAVEKPYTFTLPDIPRGITITPKGLTENRAKLMVELEKRTEPEVKEADDRKEPVTTDNTRVIAQNEKNLKIIFEAEFLQKTYLELYLDGMEKKKGIVAAGTRERWEAAEYMQLKIGNAGGIKARINGKYYT